MKHFDFIMVYEVKNREFETVCLLKHELECRGYTVYVVETWQCAYREYMPVCADIMLTFALYNDGQLQYTLQFARNVKAVVNMQWEQIYSNSDIESSDSIYKICNKAMQVYHVSWGERNVKWLTEDCGVPANRIIHAGHPSMDWTKPLFSGYYTGREELLKKYGISEHNPLVLFISSFSYVGLPKAILDSSLYQSLAESPKSIQHFSIISQERIMSWFEEAAKEHPDYTFIYRPHPAEANNERLRRMEKGLPNFKVIGEHSIKQWIYVADKIYTWFSTSVADAYYSEKSYSILRPIKMDRSMEVEIYNDAKFITSVESFKASLKSELEETPITKETFDYYYYYDKDIYTYEIICDKCEEILKQAKLQRNPAFPEYEPKKVKFAMRVYKRIKRGPRIIAAEIYGYPIFRKMLKLFGEKFMEKLENENYALQSAKKHGFTRAELKATQKRIASTIQRNKDIR